MIQLKRIVLLVTLVFITFALAIRAQNNINGEKQYSSVQDEEYLSQKGDERIAVLSAMKKELIRSKENLKLEDYEIPYFISYWIKEEVSVGMGAKYGSLYSNNRSRRRNAYVEVRVGDYSFDNTGKKNRSIFFDSPDHLSSSSYIVPIENDETAIRNVLWYVTDFKYKEAINDYLKKKGEAVFEVEEKHIDSFSKENPSNYTGPVLKIDFDEKYWRKVLTDITAYFNGFEEIFETQMRVQANKETDYYINTEGTEIITDNVLYSINISAKTRAKDGMMLDNYRDFNFRLEDDLPDYEFLMNEAKRLTEELLQLREAEVLKPYTGPAILDPDVTAVIFHEAIGHRLEGERQEDEESGQTFKDKVGEQIIPEFITVIDDPTVERYSGINLSGYYQYDNEGVPAQKVTLIADGILKNYLMSRTPIENFNHSNGHGRSSGSSWSGKPMGRMSNLFVRSKKEVPYSQLKKDLMEECRKQGKPYGLVIRHIESGETNTSKYGFQAFKQTPRLIYTVDVNTGEETLVRGAEIVGTPLTSINKITATSDNYNVLNSYCGAESGFIPVSTIAPAVLTTEIELQRTGESKGRPPLLPPPGLK